MNTDPVKSSLFEIGRMFKQIDEIISVFSSSPKWKTAFFYFTVLLATFSAYFYWLDLKNLLLSVWPIDYDSFYYLNEIRRQIQSEFFAFPGKVPFFWFFGKISVVFGLNEVQSYSAIVVSSLLLFVGGVSIISFDRRRPWVLFITIFLCFSSKILFFSHYAFPKQSAGMAALAMYFAFNKLAVHSSNSRMKTIFQFCAYAAGLMAALFHKFSGIMVILCFATSFLKRQVSKKTLLYFGALVLTFVFLSIQALPASSSLFSIRWPPLWYRFLIHKIISPFEFAEYVFCFVGGVVLLVALTRSKIRWQPLHAILFTVFILSAFFATPTGWRWGVSSAWLILLGLALFQNIPEGVPEALKTKVLLAFFVLAFSNSILFSKNPRTIGPSMAISLIEDNLELLKNWIPPNSFVQAPHGIEFRLIYFLAVESSHRSRKTFREGQRHFLLKRGNPSRRACLNPSEVNGNLESLKCLKLNYQWMLIRIN